MQEKEWKAYHVEITGNTKDGIDIDFLETVNEMLTDSNRRHIRELFNKMKLNEESAII